MTHAALHGCPGACVPAADETMRRALLIAWVAVACACDAGSAKRVPRASAPPHAATACPRFARDEPGVCAADEVDECSGMAAATTLPGAFWVHNDSGDEPRLYALSLTGELLGSVRVEGAEAVDWEDMSAAPGKLDGTRDLIVGDVGDNFARRESVQLYRIPEPSADALGQSVRAQRIELRWPDGPRDVEALFVDPLDGHVYLLEKRAVGQAGVYRVDPAAERPRPERVASVGLSLITAADMSSDGTRIVVRTYRHAWLYERAPGQSVPDALQAKPCEVPLPREPQGEAITFADPNTLLSLSEKSHQPIHRVRRIDETPMRAAPPAEPTR